MLHGDYWRRSKEVSMGDAYRTLVKAISQGDVPLRLEITAERDLVSAACWGIVEQTPSPPSDASCEKLLKVARCPEIT